MATTVTRDDYLDAALEILATDGYAGLKLAPLCRRLSITTGSFYHYFDSWPAFRAELLQTWLEQRTIQVAELAAAESDPRARLSLLVDAGDELPHRAETAIRAWAQIDDEVRVVLDDVDRQRYQLVYGAVRATVDDDQDAHRFARMALFLLVGFQQLQPADGADGADELRWSLERLVDEITAVGDRRRGARPRRVRRGGRP